jgi:ectoine hydroxylase-related dioxygenase (phytanoyl-CoA dioxygenase family)
LILASSAVAQRLALEDIVAVAPATADVSAFRRDGHVRIRGFYSAGDIARLNAALQRAKQQVRRPNGDADRSLVRDPFLSRHSEDVAAFTCDPRLGALAAHLLGARRIRLIHDVLLEKGCGQGETPWHRDSDFWSFDGIGALTAWIPLQETPLSMSPLRYASRSHHRTNVRPPDRLASAFIPFRYRVAASALETGDVVLHHYNTLHGAAPNRELRPRRALAVHFIDADARFRAPRSAEQVEHAVRCGWIQLANGEPFTDDIAPLVAAA